MTLPYKIQKNRGLVKAIVIIVVALLIISYYGLNLRDIVNKPVTQSNFAYVWEQVIHLWAWIKAIILPLIGKAVENTSATTTAAL
ncbi:MAG: hypothetical protein V4481_04600 [Patescibacteria group bacterium]